MRTLLPSVLLRLLDEQIDPSSVSEANHPLSRLRERSTRGARRVREGTPSTETTLTRAEDGVASPASGRGNDSLRSSLTGFFSSNPRGTETSVPVRSLDGQTDPSPVSEANHPLSRLRERSTREARRVREGTPSTETTLTRAEDGVASPASGRGNDSLRSSLTGFFSSNPTGKLSSCAALGFALAVLLAAPTPVLAQQRLTVEDAIREALENNTRILAARAGKEALDANAKSMRGRLGPSVHLSEELQYYDCDFGLTSFQLFQAGCVNPNNPMTPAIRKQLTNTFVVALDQPLSGLAVIGEEWRARKQQAEAADASRKTVEQTVREAVESGFLRFFEAKAAEEIARASQAQLADQIQLAKARIAAGVLTNADLLRVEVAAANARQQEIQA